MTDSQPSKPAPWSPPAPMPTRIAGAGLVLRAYEYADAPAVWEAVDQSRGSLLPWMPWANDYQCLEDAVCTIGRIMRSARAPLEPANNSVFGILFGIFDARSGEFLGGTGFNRIDAASHNAETGYWVRADRQRRGIASNALSLMLSMGLLPQDAGGLGLRRVHIFAAAENVASCGVPAKLGLRQSGCTRGDRWIAGRGWCDTVSWDVLCGEWDCTAHAMCKRNNPRKDARGG